MSGGGLFTWDAGLVRDGCYYAGYLSASVEGDTIEFPTDERDDEVTRARAHIGSEEAVGLCIAAIAEMRWAFSKSEEREESLRALWEEKKAGRNSLRYRASHELSTINYARNLSVSVGVSHPTNTFNSSDIAQRPSLPPLNLLRSPRRIESAPNSAYTTGHGANGWPSYTPPGTGTSVATSAGTGVSAKGSPIFQGMPTAPSSFKHDVQETFYHVSQDLDQFSFHPPSIGSGLSDTGLGGASHYHHREPPGSAHSLHTMTPPTNYIDPGVFASQPATMVQSSADCQGCPHFGDNCANGFYH